ncbi:uncharacterized protein LOC130776348 [Actinidia eriantha]|uniref:uncharacterized protein LOC130776348 n=1 Tax=Actinidia eriantha TaxID=165200 RepID=UPI0025859D10|nr:uncharacterized protein LOC130776348 [Actinidia eriantha]
MAIDESFKKPGAVPFKWEIRPGVPKPQQPLPPSPSHNLHRSLLQHQQQKHQSTTHQRSNLSTQLHLSPPPAGLSFHPQHQEARACSFRSSPRSRSERSRFDRYILARHETVATGCFPSPMLRRKDGKKRIHRPKTQSDAEPDYTSDLEILSRWSVSTRKSLSAFRDSPSSSSVSSYQSSPRPVCDAEWAGFGLF